jgi:hypothetical protein
MAQPTISYEELDALHDVLEAARCYWHPKEPCHSRAAETLRVVNRLYWRLGQELPHTGKPSERFRPVVSSSHGDRVQQILSFVLELTRVYANEHDPWWADVVFASDDLPKSLTEEQMKELRDGLGRLGLMLELRQDIGSNRMAASRLDLGPWGEGVES